MRVPQQAFCFAEMTAGRLRNLGMRGEITVLRGEYDGPLDPPDAATRRSRWWSTPAA